MGNIFISYFLNEQTGWLVGSLGSILETIDGGAKWNIYLYQTTSQQFNSIQFLDNENGWIFSTNFTIFRNIDGGKKWIPQYIPSLIYESNDNNIETFSLLQNYPNPFNLSTVIPIYKDSIIPPLNKLL